MSNIIESIKADYLAAYAEQKQEEKRIEAEAEKARAAALRYQRLAAQKMGEYHKLSSKSYSAVTVRWTDDIVRPILREVDKRTGLNFSEDADNKVLSCFGLRCECPVFARDEKGECIAVLKFTPGNEGMVYIDSGENTGEYHPNSIGGMNGFGNVTEEVTSIEVIIDNLCRRYPELKESFENHQSKAI